MTDRVFITGGSGLLALNWALAVRDRASVILALHDRVVAMNGVDAVHCGLDTVDEVARAIDAIQPTMVIHAAGLASVEGCEADEALARHVNVEIAHNVAAACVRSGVPLAHISTDHLFRGDEALVTEQHPVDPQNVYARTKAMAEQRVLDVSPDALVVRTNFFGWGPRHRRSFSDRIIDPLRLGERVTLFTDVFYTPILVETLSHAVHDLLRAGAGGIVHVTGDERVSKHEFGLRVARRFGLDAGLIRAGLASNEPSRVRRPRDMSLSNARAREMLGRSLGDVDAHLDRLHQQKALGLAEEMRNL